MNQYSIYKTPNQVLFDLAEKFKKLRKSKSISQSKLAKKSDVSLGSIKRFEQTGQISLESLLKLAHYFNRLDDFDLVFKLDENIKEIEKLFR